MSTPEPRALRSLVPFEAAAVVALAVVPLPEPMPVALPLVVVASASRWVRRRDWGSLFAAERGTAGLGAAAGLIALVAALALGAPIVEAVSGRAVEWSAYPIVRGSASQTVLVALIAVAMVLATELA